MSDGTEWGIPLDRPSKQFMALKPSSRGPMGIERKPGGRVTAPGAGPDEATRLRKVAEDFEAVFLFQVLKQMRNTIHKEEMFHGGLGEEVFTEMMDEELAKKMAGRGVTGIAETIFRQLSRQYGISPTGTEAPPLPDLSGAAGKLQRLLRGVEAEAEVHNTGTPSPRF